jgi:hypothetical protein
LENVVFKNVTFRNVTFENVLIEQSSFQLSLVQGSDTRGLSIEPVNLPSLTGVVDHFSGSAEGVGRGATQTGIAIVGSFVLSGAVDLSAVPSVLTITSLLNDGHRDVAGLPLILFGSPRNTRTTAYFSTARGQDPAASVAIGARGNNKFTLRIKVTRATSEPSDECPHASLTTAFGIQLGATHVEVSTQQAWLCFGTGNQYLRSPR